MSAELLPCPFCGGEACFDDSLARGDHAAECADCKCSTPLVDCNHDAAAIWNRRAALAFPAEARDRLAGIEKAALAVVAIDSLHPDLVDTFEECEALQALHDAVAPSDGGKGI